jgi:hypothetical protein
MVTIAFYHFTVNTILRFKKKQKKERAICSFNQNVNYCTSRKNVGSRQMSPALDAEKVQDI